MTVEKAYFGEGLSWENYDDLMFRVRNAKWIDEERSLFACKWFDYRQMHPADATYLYAHEYELAYRSIYAKTFDRRAAEFIKVFKSKDIFAVGGQTLGGIWRGRQVADMMGMPYHVFLPLAFEERLRAWNRPHMPMPWHLYNFGFAIEAIDKKWVERQESSLITATRPFFRVENYAGIHAQNDHHEWLFSQAMMRTNPAPVIGRFMRDQLLPIDKVRARMGDDMVQQAFSYT